MVTIFPSSRSMAGRCGDVPESWLLSSCRKAAAAGAAACRDHAMLPPLRIAQGDRGDCALCTAAVAMGGGDCGGDVLVYGVY
jgi:hypothetical protein